MRPTISRPRKPPAACWCSLAKSTTSCRPRSANRRTRPRAIPKQITDIVTEAATSGGATAGLAKFKELRTQFYGGQSYDFSENSLLTIAQRANAAQKPDDALAYVQANLEYYPKSVRSYLLLSQIHQAKNDKDAAIKDVEKALEIDPNSNQAKARLQQLKGGA